jgi:hypothetical protein
MFLVHRRSAEGISWRTASGFLRCRRPFVLRNLRSGRDSTGRRRSTVAAGASRGRSAAGRSRSANRGDRSAAGRGRSANRGDRSATGRGRCTATGAMALDPSALHPTDFDLATPLLTAATPMASRRFAGDRQDCGEHRHSHPSKDRTRHVVLQVRKCGKLSLHSVQRGVSTGDVDNLSGLRRLCRIRRLCR